jgi:hypothetical protein
MLYGDLPSKSEIVSDSLLAENICHIVGVQTIYAISF